MQDKKSLISWSKGISINPDHSIDWISEIGKNCQNQSTRRSTKLSRGLSIAAPIMGAAALTVGTIALALVFGFLFWSQDDSMVFNLSFFSVFKAQDSFSDTLIRCQLYNESFILFRSFIFGFKLGYYYNLDQGLFQLI